MAKFMFLFQGDNEPADMDAQMKAWGDYAGGLAQKGIVEGGNPFGKIAKTVTTTGVVEEAMSPTTNGYMIINAADFDEALEYTKGCPALEIGNAIAILDIQEMNM